MEKRHVRRIVVCGLELVEKEIMCDEIKVQELDPTTRERLMVLFKGRLFARFGDTGYTMPASYKTDSENFRNMTVRSDDVWIAGFPRSGTTWMQELVWLVKNDFDYITALKIPLKTRYLFLERNYLTNLEKQKLRDSAHPALREELYKSRPGYEAIANAPPPRFIKTHIPFSLLPSTLLDTTKVVYVARDPRDVAVSFYHLHKLVWELTGNFKEYWNTFMNDSVTYTPFFSHLKEAWALHHHPNMLFLFYEDMLKDLPLAIKQVAEFFSKEVTNQQIVTLCEHLDMKNFKKNMSVNPVWIPVAENGNPNAEGFARNGISGAWRGHFDEEMTVQAREWTRVNLAGTDLRFPLS